MLRKILVVIIGFLLVQGSPGAFAQIDVDEEIQRLEKRLKKLQKKDAKRNRSLIKKLTKSSDRMRINGFASAGLSTTDSDAEFVLEINDTKNYQIDTVVGMQFSFQVNSKTDAVLQLLGRGVTANDVEAEWAYVSYQATPTLKVRGGRLRIPFYNHSEFLDVGYAYNRVRPNSTMYSLAPFTSYYGMDILADFSFFGGEHSLQIYNGTDDMALELLGFKINLYGAYWASEYGPITFRVGRTIAKIGAEFDFIKLQEGFSADVLGAIVASGDMGDLLGADGFVAEFTSYGVMYDDGVWFSNLEVADLFIDFLLNSYDLMDFTLGRRFNRWSPFIGFGKQYSKDETHLANYLLANLPEGDFAPPFINSLGVDSTFSQTYTAGVRFEWKTGVAVKLQLDHFTRMKGTRGMFISDPGENTQLFSLVIDAAF
ncbi:MAG: hypothetical protein COB51_03840 [Moraxellaceae bacterium]|nr:MAG: hypothetical protein COB51_03840 [Moraxellaceae bacterium]